jgi:predicted transcriptional regulator
MRRMTSLPPPFKKRGRLTILYALLTILQTGPAKKTHLMYRANLSHRTLHKFLTVLLEKDLCAEVRRNGRTAYRITAKGQRFVHEFQTIRTLFDG